MRKLILLLLLLTFSARAADTYVKINVTATNLPVTGNSATVNGIQRIFTNATSAIGWVATNTTIALSATNYFSAFSTFQQSAIILGWVNSTNFTIEGTNLTFSIGGAWCYVSTGTTNTIGPRYTFQGPYDSYAATSRTNWASETVYGSRYTTNAFPTNAVALSNYVSASPVAQSFGNKTITNGVIDGTRISNAVAIVGTALRITNGVYITPALISPSTTNLTNYGLAISSPGPCSFCEQFGSGSIANTNLTSAAGYSALATAYGASAFGASSTAKSNYSSAIGNSTLASGYASTAIGYGAQATASNSAAIGVNAVSDQADSIAIGNNAAPSDTNQIILGPQTGTTKVFIPGRLIAASITNSTITGTNQWTGDLAYPMYSLTTLANGNNLAVPFTNVFVAVSGPSAAFTINGIYGGRSGREVWLINRSGQTMTIANESGVDPTPANRITLSPASDAQYSDGQLVHFLYDGTSSRWRASVPTASVTNSMASNSASFTIVTNDWVVNTYYTNVAQRAYVSATLILTATVTANAKVALYLDQDGDGTWEQTGIAAQTGLGLATADWFQLGAFLQPSARFMYTNLSTGAATASVNGGSSQWVKQ